MHHHHRPDEDGDGDDGHHYHLVARFQLGLDLFNELMLMKKKEEEEKDEPSEPLVMMTSISTRGTSTWRTTTKETRMRKRRSWPSSSPMSS
jgi:hypothetical protein